MFDNVMNKAPQHPVDDEQIIRASARFDAEWYLIINKDIAKAGVDPIKHYVSHGAKEGREPAPWFSSNVYRRTKGGDLLPDANPFSHFLRFGCEDDILDRGLLTDFSPKTIRTAVKRLERLSLFRNEDYLNLNSSLRDIGVTPAQHAITYGFSEGRNVFKKTTVAKILGKASRATDLAVAAQVKKPKSFLDVDVLYNTSGNSFIREIAEDVVLCLERAGTRANLKTETSEHGGDPRLRIIVAPHEFFQVGSGASWAYDSVVSNAILFNTEQPQTLWFERGMPFILMSKGVIDLSPQISSILATSGTPTFFFNPSIPDRLEPLTQADQKHSLVRVLPTNSRSTPQACTTFRNRPIDVSFFGGHTERRDAFFSRNSEYFAALNCFLYYRKFSGPILDKSGRDSVLSRLATHVCGHSKINLNIHRDEYGFFEWHRIVRQGMAAGSLVVTEHCLPHPLFRAGEHFFEESGRHIPDLISWLLNTDDGAIAAERVRLKAHLAVTHAPEVEQNGRRLAEFIQEVSGGKS